MRVKGVDMTEAFHKFIIEVSHKQMGNNPHGSFAEVGFAALSAFVQEVEREIGKARFRTSINVASAYEKFVREFGLDGEGK